MIYPNQKAGVMARLLDLPQPIVDYVFLERLYRQMPERTPELLEETGLHPLLYQQKGPYLLVPGIDRLFLKFSNGLTLSARNAMISWHDLFIPIYRNHEGIDLRQIEYILDRAALQHCKLKDKYY